MSWSFAQAAREAPDNVALVVDGKAYTYGELAPAVERAVRFLAARAARHSEAGVALEASLELGAIVLTYAAFELGTPALLLHPRLGDRERRQLMEAAAITLAVDARALSTGADEGAAVLARPAPADDARCLAMVATSGSSGRPRCVELSRAAFRAAAEASAANLGWRADDRWLLALPFAHIGGLSVLTRCLLARRAVVLCTGSSFAIERTLESLTRDRVTLASLVPAQLALMLDRRPRASPPPSLRALLVGGAAASPELLEHAARRGWPVLATYGLTEACSQVATQHHPGRGSEPGCGRPLPGMEVQIRSGAIHIRGRALFTRYLPDAGRPRPFEAGGWFDTGDLGRIDEQGCLHILGRADDVIITGGEKVAPAEVERALTASGLVKSACVFGIADATFGQVVAAALVPTAAGAPELGTLAAALATRLASFKRPRRIAYLDQLPLTPTGKLDRPQVIAASLPLLRPLQTTRG